MDDSTNSFSDSGNSNLVTARGTGDGLVIRINAEAETFELTNALKEYITARKSFIGGNSVSLEWVAGIPADDCVEAVKECLKTEFGINVKSVDSSSEGLRVTKTSTFSPPRGGSDTSGLFAGIDSLNDSIEGEVEVGMEEAATQKSSSYTNSMFWDNPDAMIMHATLRSGQKIETEHSLVLVGDVNCGAEIVAGGDIVVLGKLRGVVHAGAYDEAGGGRFIFSLDLQPTQLRIGSIISRGEEMKSQKVPEVAFVDGNMIVVEPYCSRSAAGKMQG